MTEQEEQPDSLMLEWVDWDLAKEIAGLMHERIKAQPAYGIGIATLALVIVGAIRTPERSDAPPELTTSIMQDTFRFMTELFNKGWDRPPPKEQRN